MRIRVGAEHWLRGLWEVGRRPVGYCVSQTIYFVGWLLATLVLTGNTTGTPPRTGLLPSIFAAVLTQRFSLPLLFQLVTVAPNNSTSTESREGSEAMTRPCSVWTLGCGPVKEGLRAEGRFRRSILLVSWRGMV